MSSRQNRVELQLSAIFATDPVLMFPISTWRVDTVMLILLGALFVPISAGRWIPRRAEGAAMLIAYALYMTATVAVAMR